MPESTPDPGRIVSLDQFRGYTVLGMFLVNFVGSYAAIKASLPLLAHHHTYCSYADTIMPQFFFAVGFAYRLTFLRRWERDGPRAAWAHAIRRNLGLLLLGFVIHHLDGKYNSWAKLRELGLGGFLQTAFQRSFFQTLTHIGVTSLWVLPVIAARPAIRILYALFSAILFHYLSAEWGYYEWVLKRPGIDGGPLGFLTWTIPLLVGSLAYDAMTEGKPAVLRFVFWGAMLCLLGYALSCLGRVPTDLAGSDWRALLVEPPFVPPAEKVNIWTMSQRAGSVSYLTFGAGFSLVVFALFALACDRGPVRIGLFRTLGTNALAGYIIHDLVNGAIKPLVPSDSPLWYVFTGCGLSLMICYLFLRYLEKRALFLKL